MTYPEAGERRGRAPEANCVTEDHRHRRRWRRQMAAWERRRAAQDGAGEISRRTTEERDARTENAGTSFLSSTFRASDGPYEAQHAMSARA